MTLSSCSILITIGWLRYNLTRSPKKPLLFLLLLGFGRRNLQILLGYLVGKLHKFLSPHDPLSAILLLREVRLLSILELGCNHVHL